MFIFCPICVVQKIVVIFAEAFKMSTAKLQRYENRPIKVKPEKPEGDKR